MVTEMACVEVEPQTPDRCDGWDFSFLVPVLIIDSSYYHSRSLIVQVLDDAVNKKSTSVFSRFWLPCRTLGWVDRGIVSALLTGRHDRYMGFHPKCPVTVHFEV